MKPTKQKLITEYNYRRSHVFTLEEDQKSIL